MKKTLLLFCGMLMSFSMQAADFETAKDAVKNMGVGWNLGNTLDAADASKTWTTTAQHETCWGQPVTKPELMKMMKDAGFGAIRVPVTWYQEMDKDGKVNDAWMNRVKEVVDYVIDNGMYCIINVHHDTGDGKQWLHASTTNYDTNKAKYEYLWKQIAEKFKDYGQKLLFEAYNEMLDDNNKWNEPASDDGYKAINSYAKSFVTTVRNTGGNNKDRNLVVNTYSASSTPNAMKNLDLPEETGHIIFQLHSYPNWKSESNAKAEIDNLINNIKSNLLNRAPVIIGEYATFTTWPSDIDYYATDKKVALYAMDYMVKKAKENGIGTFYWMGLSDGIYRSEPAFNQADLAETLIKAYYGSSENYKFPTHDSSKGTVAFEGEKTLEWGQGVTVPASMLKEVGKQVEVELSYKLDFLNFEKKDDQYCDIQFMYNKGGWQKIPSGLSMDSKAFEGADFHPDEVYGINSGDSKTSVLSFNDSAFELVASNDLIIQGHGVIMTKVVVKAHETSGISNALINKNSNDAIYNLNGQRISNPRKGIYIQNGKKYVMK